MSRNSRDNDDSLRPETSLNTRRPFTDEGTRSKPSRNPQTQDQGVIIRNAATASNFKAIPIPKNSPQTFEKMGFLDRKEKNNEEYRPPVMMPNVRNFNNYVGIKPLSTKGLPKTMTIDKERLYEENLSLKTILNVLKQENMQLKTKLSSLDRENFKFEKIIYDIDYINNKKAGKTHHNWTPEVSNPTIINLRRQLKENQAFLSLKEKEIENLRKAPKLTRISELETELKHFAEETVRLRKMLDESLRLNFPENKSEDFQLAEKLLMQSSMLTSLNKERLDLITMIQNLNDQVIRKNMKVDELESQIMLLKADKQKKGFQIKKVNNQPSNSQHKDSSKKQQKSIHIEKEELKATLEEKQQDEMMRKELEQKTADLSNMSVKLSQKEKKIAELERKIKEINADFAEKLEMETKEKTSFSLKLDKERKELKALTQKYQNLLGSKQAEKDGFDEEKAEQAPEKSPHSTKTIPGQIEKKRLMKVNYYDIEEIGLMLRYNLKLRDIPIERVSEFISETSVKSEYSIAEVVGILEAEPFVLKEADKRVLLARYLIEDNSLDYVFFDNNLKASVAVIRSVLKKTLGSYKLFTEKEKRTFHSEISSLLLRVKPTLEDTLKSSAIKKGGPSNRTSTKDDLLTCLKFCEIHLNPKQMDYFFMRLWEVEGKLDAFSIEKLFQVFDSTHIIKEEVVEKMVEKEDFEKEEDSYDNKVEIGNKNGGKKRTSSFKPNEEKKKIEENLKEKNRKSIEKGKQQESIMKESFNKNVTESIKIAAEKEKKEETHNIKESIASNVLESSKMTSKSKETHSQVLSKENMQESSKVNKPQNTIEDSLNKKASTDHKSQEKTIPSNLQSLENESEYREKSKPNLNVEVERVLTHNSEKNKVRLEDDTLKKVDDHRKSDESKKEDENEYQEEFGNGEDDFQKNEVDYAQNEDFEMKNEEEGFEENKENSKENLYEMNDEGGNEFEKEELGDEDFGETHQKNPDFEEENPGEYEEEKLDDFDGGQQHTNNDLGESQQKFDEELVDSRE